MKLLLLTILLIALVPVAAARPKKKLKLWCAGSVCTEQEMRRLVKAGAIPPARPYKPCPPDVCAQGDRIPANGCGCP